MLSERQRCERNKIVIDEIVEEERNRSEITLSFQIADKRFNHRAEEWLTTTIYTFFRTFSSTPLSFRSPVYFISDFDCFFPLNAPISQLKHFLFHRCHADITFFSYSLGLFFFPFDYLPMVEGTWKHIRFHLHSHLALLFLLKSVPAIMILSINAFASAFLAVQNE